jgi:preprotein translocase subunit SecA
VDAFIDDAHNLYEKREEELGEDNMKEFERQVWLSVLDRKWREHLYEMDYLREGIGLRAMAHRDPLVEYKREGAMMFDAMQQSFKEDVVSFLFNANVQVRAPQPKTMLVGPTEEPEGLRQMLGHDDNEGLLPEAQPAPKQRSVAEVANEAAAQASRKSRPTRKTALDSVVSTTANPAPRPAPAQKLSYSGPSESGAATTTATAEKSIYEGVGRNAPCPCGSGKKFKNCHGRAQNQG